MQWIQLLKSRHFSRYNWQNLNDRKKDLIQAFYEDVLIAQMSSVYKENIGITIAIRNNGLVLSV